MAKLKPNQFILSGHLITEIPLLFQTEMVKAIMKNRKTETRRANGLDSFNVDRDFWSRKGNPMKNSVRIWDSTKENNPNPISISFGFKDPFGFIEYVKSRYGKPGDLLWVKETWNKTPDFLYAYKANLTAESESIRQEYLSQSGNQWAKWKPSIHMPKSASRIWVMVEEIRVERLQDITEKSAIAEGIEKVNIHGQDSWKRYDGYAFVSSSPIVSYWSLWASINGEESWNSNPWVWVVKFRVLSKTGRPSDDLILEHYNQITQNHE
jgi:hypothetical protein